MATSDLHFYVYSLSTSDGKPVKALKRIFSTAQKATEWIVANPGPHGFAIEPVVRGGKEDLLGRAGSEDRLRLQYGIILDETTPFAALREPQWDSVPDRVIEPLAPPAVQLSPEELAVRTLRVREEFERTWEASFKAAVEKNADWLRGVLSSWDGDGRDAQKAEPKKADGSEFVIYSHGCGQDGATAAIYAQIMSLQRMAIKIIEDRKGDAVHGIVEALKPIHEQMAALYKATVR